MKFNKILYILLFASFFAATSCVKDLDVEPIDPNLQTATNVFKDDAAYKMALARLYASYAISGQTGGGGGNPDIQGIDEGFGNYLRVYWNLQQLPTDEAIIAWDDATIKNFHWQTWAPNDVFISALYSRIFYAIALENEFIRVSTDRLGSATGAFADDLKRFQAEARFLRAFSYFHAIDMFGNVPFITEKDKPGAFMPQQTTRAELFTYIETELKAIEMELAAPKANEYGRADRAAAWMLLAKLYMNAQVYTGTARYGDAVTYLKKVINEGGYTLDANYQHLFLGDNNLSNEIIFPICFDGTNTQQYGGMTFLLHASAGGGMPNYGHDGGWGGIRAVKELPEYFGVSESNFSISQPQPKFSDARALFFYNPENWVWETNNVGTFTHGVGVVKFRNISRNGGPAPNAHPTFASIDFPVFRLADAHLMYAECAVRGAAGADRATALTYVNTVRARSGASAIVDAELTLSWLLDERARELYWEGHRRTDLIRFGEFTNGNKVWTWKGNTKAGQKVPAFRDLYPIPSDDLTANTNLKQNAGY